MMIKLLDEGISYGFAHYRSFKNLLEAPIDLSRLPVTGEKKIFKPSASRYGHVIIKLDLERDEDIIAKMYSSLYSYTWEVDQYEVFQADATTMPIPKEYELMIYNEIKIFTTIFKFANTNDVPLRFSVIGGSDKIAERPCHAMATTHAIINLLQNLNKK